jgi:hypothetical protein
MSKETARIQTRSYFPINNRFPNKKPSTVCQMNIDLSIGQTFAKLAAVLKKMSSPSAK